MNDKCSCYKIIRTSALTPHPVDGHLVRHEVEQSVCFGTKEMDVCGCNGNRMNCSFYPNLREEAKKEIAIQEAINHFNYGISHDIFKEPVTSYARLAVEALEKQIVPNGISTRADQIRSMDDEELAKFLLDCDRNDLGFCHVGVCPDEATCTDCILKWLQKPVEE